MCIFLLVSKITINQILNANIEELLMISNIYTNTTYGYDNRFEINKKDINHEELQSISINMKKKKMLNILLSDKVSTNKKIDLVKKNEILTPSNISQINFFAGGLMKDFDFYF